MQNSSFFYKNDILPEIVTTAGIGQSGWIKSEFNELMWKALFFSWLCWAGLMNKIDPVANSAQWYDWIGCCNFLMANLNNSAYGLWWSPKPPYWQRAAQRIVDKFSDYEFDKSATNRTKRQQDLATNLYNLSIALNEDLKILDMSQRKKIRSPENEYWRIASRCFRPK